MENTPHADDVITITLNPAIDETVFLDRLVSGAVNRARHHQRQAGGKGVNVSSMLAGYGIASTASGFLGMKNPRLFAELFHETGIHDAFIRISGETRTGVKIVANNSCETTDINLPGARPSDVDFKLLLEKIGALARAGSWVVVAGSLPDGFQTSDFELLLRFIRETGARIAVDTSGAPLQAAIDSGVDLIKPNHHEIAEILGQELPDTASIVAAATRIQRDKVSHVILSLGAEGALFANPEGVYMTQPPPVRVVSTVGAGDSLLAGYLAGLLKGFSAVECAKLASVFAWCALEDPRRRLCSSAEIDNRMSRIAVDSVHES